MPSKMYGGVRYEQIRHAVYCKKCLDTVESKSVHDRQMCSCGAVGVDGGTVIGNTIIGNPEDYEDRSVWRSMGIDPVMHLSSMS